MYAVEFESDINNGIVHIPSEYKELQQRSGVKFLLIVSEEKNKTKKSMNAISIDTKKYKFNRDEANER